MGKENKKGRSIVNIFDIVLIVIAIALAAVYFLSRTGPSTSPFEAESVTVRYTVETAELDENFQGIVKPGDQVVDKIKKYNIGTVESVSYRESLRSVKDYEAGARRLTPVPGRVTMSVVITAPATLSDSAITVDGGYDVRVGTEANIKTAGFACSGFIVAVERVGER